MDDHPLRGDNPHSALRIPQFLHGGNIHAFARARGIRPEEVLDFSASINPLGWPRGVRDAYRQALSQAVHYPEPYAETLTATLAQYHGLDPRSFVIGNGSTQLIYLLARVFKPQRVLVVAPTFSEHESALSLAGARVSRFILRPPTFTLTIEKLRPKLAEGYDTLIVTNPNSPTGTLVPDAAMQEVVQLCRRLGIRLLVDETFVDWVEDASLKSLAQRLPHLIVLRSLTKFFAIPGLRVGYVIAHPKNIQRLRKQLEPWSVNTIAQTVATACLRDSQFVLRSRAFMERERQWFERQLRTIPGIETFPSSANFFLVKIKRRSLTAADMAQQLAVSSILIRDCSNFVGLGKQFFRVAIRRRAENKRLLAALQVVFGGKDVGQI
jgi:threonine-phosphate decarboxylase